jgi:hypothetical protein
MVLADTGSDYSAIPRSTVEDARKRGFPLKVEVLPVPIMLNMAIRVESDKQKCSANKMLMPAVTIATLSGPLCKLGADPPANVRTLVINLREDAESVRLSSRKYARL